MKRKQSIECWIFHRSLRKYLLLQCPETNRHPKYWQPVTGGVHPRETVVQACRREVLEETGIALEPSDITIVLNEYRVWVPEYKLEVRKPVFTAETTVKHVMISDEHLAYHWVAPQEVKTWLFWESNKSTFRVVDTYYQKRYQF